MLDKKTIYQKYKNAGQDHVFRFYEELSEEAKTRFLIELDRVDLSELANIFKITKMYKMCSSTSFNTRWDHNKINHKGHRHAHSTHSWCLC